MDGPRRSRGLGGFEASSSRAIRVRSRVLRPAGNGDRGPLAGRGRRASPTLPRVRAEDDRIGRVHVHQRTNRRGLGGSGPPRDPSPRALGWRTGGRNRPGRAQCHARSRRRGGRGSMAQRRVRCGQAISVPPCEVRHRRRAGRLDRVGKFRGGGISNRGERKPRMVRPCRRRGLGDSSPERLRNRLRRAPARFDPRTDRVGAGNVGFSAVAAADHADAVGQPPSSPGRRTGRQP